MLHKDRKSKRASTDSKPVRKNKGRQKQNIFGEKKNHYFLHLVRVWVTPVPRKPSGIFFTRLLAVDMNFCFFSTVAILFFMFPFAKYTFVMKKTENLCWSSIGKQA